MTQTLSANRATEFEIRPVADDELRAASNVFREALHEQPVSDEQWPLTQRAYESGRTYGAFAGSLLAGTTTSLASSLTVPGGAILPMAAVTAVGVRTDQRRRGALSGLMRRQLDEAAAAGEVFAGLHASEPTIYGRFGYGIGTRSRTIRVRSARARMRPEVPTAGTMRLLGKDDVLSQLPAAYAGLLSAHTGMMGRPTGWWVMAYERRMTQDYFRVAAHLDADGAIDGFVGYRPRSIDSDDPRDGSALMVLDFVAANQAVENDLWRFLLDIDLVEEVTVYARPLDDPIEAMVVDLYALRSDPDDELWLRIVDVPTALGARAYGQAEPVVVEVLDPMLPSNAGRYRLGPGGVERTDADAALTLTAETLAMVYLGTWRPSALAAIGRIAVSDPAALPAADRLFATDRASWCGTLF